MSDEHHRSPGQELPKCPTGIQGLDEITGGGFPRGRPTLICGAAGCGKTLMAMEFLLHGAMRYDEPGVFVTFEETAAELAQNVRSLGYDLAALEAAKSVAVDYVRVERSEIEEMDGYDLEGLFIRLDLAINSVGAKRVVLDTIETLFGGFMNQSILRAELRRLFRWLKDKGVTAVITGERGDGSLTRQGLEEYVSDCVIMLDHRVTDQVSTRRLRIVKYRGTAHGTNEYPFLIDEDGISVLPVTSLGLTHDASDERVPTGIAALDEMLAGGYYRGSTVLVSGTAGSGKTSVSAHLALAACERGERCLYFAFEESERQFLRNMRSIGIDLEPYIDQGLLEFHASRPLLQGLELHLVRMHKLVRDARPAVVIVDPVSNFVSTASAEEVTVMLTRLIDYLKTNAITVMMTNLTSGSDAQEQTKVNISSIVDTWLLLRDTELNGERNRVMYILKSRGMAHSNQLREFLITGNGVDLVDAYVGSGGVLTGSARLSQEAREEAERLANRQNVERRLREIDRKRRSLEAHIAGLRSEFEDEEKDLKQLIEEERNRAGTVAEGGASIGLRRGGGARRRPASGQGAAKT
ncbi:MAG: circadian clock protein KaiC [Woeseia sp.]